MTWRLPFFSAALALLLVTMGCKKADTTATTPEVANAPATVKLQLNWFPEAQHGGFYQAAATGLYKDANLTVNLAPGGGKVSVEDMVNRGMADFGIVNADKLLQARASGMKLVALMAPFQKFPRCIIVKSSSPFQSIGDLKDTTITANDTKPYFVYLKDKYDLSSLRVVPYEGGLATFINNDNFATQGYVTSEPLTLRKQGVEVRSFMLYEEGFNPYANVLFTSEKFLAENPDVCRRMVEASQAGWVAYLADPAAGNADILKVNTDTEQEVLDFSVEQQRALMLTDEADATSTFGTMTEHRWQELRDQLVRLKEIKEEPKEPISAAYTTRFLKSQAE